jgi:HEAT repeats
MRIAAIGATLLLALQSCSTTQNGSDSPYVQPNSLMAGEITRRIEQIPYQHRDELLQNLLWLSQTGEQTIPSLLTGLQHENPKVRSSCAWVLGRLRDHRTVPNLQAAMRDSEATVRLECARTLVVLGDLTYAPNLIEGLESERKEVRYLCHEALKNTTGHDFGYDHLNQDEGDLKLSVLRWRQWWSDYSGDTLFAQSYQQRHQLQPQAAVPAGETQMTGGDTQPDQAPQQNEPQNEQQNAQPVQGQPQTAPAPNAPTAPFQQLPTPRPTGGQQQSSDGNGGN